MKTRTEHLSLVVAILALVVSGWSFVATQRLAGASDCVARHERRTHCMVQYTHFKLHFRDVIRAMQSLTDASVVAKLTPLREEMETACKNLESSLPLVDAEDATQETWEAYLAKVAAVSLKLEYLGTRITEASKTHGR